jgi:hypothetical protein
MMLQTGGFILSSSGKESAMVLFDDGNPTAWKGPTKIALNAKRNNAMSRAVARNVRGTLMNQFS